MITSFDYLNNPYESRRITSVANRGMVATGQPLASQVGLSILKQGGNAIDAAIATAAALTVLEPTANGIGGDAFALVWVKGKMYGLNGSGPAPKSISIDKVKARGYSEMPRHGWIPVTVPGAPGAWAELSRRFGNLSLTEVLAPAIDYAEKGYPISPVLAKYWQLAFKRYKEILTDKEFTHWFETFAPNGNSPKIGDIWKSPAHAETLRLIGETNATSFYKGTLADKIVAFAEKHDGFLKSEDLASYQPSWVDPISINYHGYDVWEIPPNGQGMIALLALNILEGYDFPNKEAVDTYHKQIEATKLAFADGKKYITDEKDMPFKAEQFLAKTYAEKRRALIQEEALIPEPGIPPQSGTVYLATADDQGNMVSFIQSNYMGFGSGLVVPDTGIALQNRGHSFSLDKNDHNALQGGKKTYHTIIPGFLSKGNEPVGPFGVMGGFMQPQGHVQVVMNTVNFGLNPQAALDAPRWQWRKGKEVVVEADFPANTAEALSRKGHEISGELEHGGFGRGQIIFRDNKTGTLYGGTETRTEGTIAAY